MACEAEFQVMTTSAAALAASVQSYDQKALELQQLAAVVAANAEAVSAAQTAYSQCLMNQGGGGMMRESLSEETREVVKHSRHGLRQAAEVLEWSSDLCEACDVLCAAIAADKGR